MRFRSLSFFLALALASGVAASPPERQSSAVGGDVERRGLAEFLAWAHPAGNGCEAPRDIAVLESWDGGLRAGYRIVCGPSASDLEGVFQVRGQVRDRETVWQVSAGFEAIASRIEGALGRRRDAAGRAAPGAPAGRTPVPPPPAGLPAPPPNTGAFPPDSPLRFVAPPEATLETTPEYPEEAGRARLIGEAHVELLVQISPEGLPERARPLRGPDPDLGMRRAAIDAVMRWRFDPARLGGGALTYFRPVDLKFGGVPPESRDWVHRALFHVEAIVSDDDLVVQEALRRLGRGEPFETVAAQIGEGVRRGGDWGFVSAASFPAVVRKALHEARVDSLAGPVAAEGRHYLLLKRGEVYYAFDPRAGGGGRYEILHRRNAPEGEALRKAVEADILDCLAESRRQAYLDEAARTMGIRQVETEIGQLEIRTDVLDEEETRILGQVVESAVRAHEDFWKPLVPLRPFTQKVQVYVWARQADHDRMHRLWLASGGASAAAETAAEGKEGAPAAGTLWNFAGEYVPASRVLSVPAERMAGHLPVPTMIHEAIHMLDYERVYASGSPPSRWFEEGLATYFGFSQIGSRLNIQPGDIRRSGTIVSGTVRVQFDPRTPLRDYIKRIGDKEPLHLAALLGSKSGDALWSGDRVVLAYGASWTLVHFLMHGDKGTHRAAFEDYARAEAEGRGGYDTFVRLFGPDLAALEDAWHRYEADL